MAITGLTIIKSNVTSESNLVAVHSPLSFIVEATYTGAAPDIGTVTAGIYSDGELLGSFRCNVLKDVIPGIRQFYFRADAILRGYMEDFNDFVQGENSFVPVDYITKEFKIIFAVNGVTPLPEVEFVACHGARQFGESENMEDIATNQENTYLAVKGEPVYVYFFNGDDALVPTIGDTSIDNFDALDFDDIEFTDFDDVTFTIDALN